MSSKRPNSAPAAAGALFFAALTCFLFQQGRRVGDGALPVCDPQLPPAGESCTYLVDPAAAGNDVTPWLGLVAMLVVTELARYAGERGHSILIRGACVLALLGPCGYLLVLHVFGAGAGFQALLTVLLALRMLVRMFSSPPVEVAVRYLVGHVCAALFVVLAGLLIGYRSGESFPGPAGAVLRWVLESDTGTPDQSWAAACAVAAAVVAFFGIQDGWRASAEDVLDIRELPKPALAAAHVANLLGVATVLGLIVYLVSLGTAAAGLGIGAAVFLLLMLGVTHQALNVRDSAASPHRAG
ncbi:hypothetical protein [Amycolatopsis nigrescens]|uniref:hypothetical protein n=1 Tax=Amycolatopsis nigrescens TaxID=381445 RepID=UPI00035EEB30|nr:hypothetical protein [Amycolatopsis nigrescens]